MCSLGSSDYFGLNHYRTHYVRDESNTTTDGSPHFDKDLQATIYANDSWQQADVSDWLQVRTTVFILLLNPDQQHL